MGQTVAVLLSGAFGAAVALLGTWSSRWQTRAQESSRQQQIRQQSRREAYIQFLAALAHARREFSEIRHLLCVEPRDLGEARRALDSARAQVYEVQHATAIVLVEGPNEIAGVARSAQESIELFYSSLKEWLVDLASGSSVETSSQQCIRQSMRAKASLERFAEACSSALESNQVREGESNPSEPSSDSELLWLTGQLSTILERNVDAADRHSTAVELGMDSILTLRLCAAIRSQYGLEREDVWPWTDRTIDEIATYLATARISEAG